MWFLLHDWILTNTELVPRVLLGDRPTGWNFGIGLVIPLGLSTVLSSLTMGNKMLVIHDMQQHHNQAITCGLF